MLATPAEQNIMAGFPISLKVEKTYPPNIEAIDRRFNVRGKQVIFAYGDTIFNPKGVEITPELLQHEVTHLLQQRKIEPVLWWERYIDDPQFRLAQEIPAHQAEYLAHLKRNPNRHQRRGLVKQIAKRLSGPLYGKLISLNDAKALLDRMARAA